MKRIFLVTMLTIFGLFYGNAQEEIKDEVLVNVDIEDVVVFSKLTDLVYKFEVSENFHLESNTNYSQLFVKSIPLDMFNIESIDISDSLFLNTILKNRTDTSDKFTLSDDIDYNIVAKPSKSDECFYYSLKVWC